MQSRTAILGSGRRGIRVVNPISFWPMADLPDVTVILGPQTRVAIALNAHLRENRHYLRMQGVTAVPSRLATPIVRRAIDERAEAERVEEFNAKATPRPIVLSAIGMFGQPQNGLANGELFPDAEVALANFAPFLKQGRVVFCIDALPAFFLAAGAPALEERVRQTAWEILYELSWHELLSEIVDLLPDASFVILTQEGFGKDPRKALELILGSAGEGVPHPHTMLRQMIDQTGHAVLDRMLARGLSDKDTLVEVYKSFVMRPTKDDLKDRLGMDKVTNILLEQRFAEDLVEISKLSRVQVI